MPTNPYYNNFPSIKSNQQRLFERLLAESIRNYGMDLFYMPRENFDESDFIFGENVKSRFERAYQMEMYLLNTRGWTGDGDYFSKFGLEIRENLSLVLMKTTFEKYVPTTIAIRPREGDIIYIPVVNKIVEIKFVEEEVTHFSFGHKFPYMYQLECETFRFGNEDLDTGMEDIDQLKETSLYTIALNIRTNRDFHNGERIFQGPNLTFSTAAATVSNWIPGNNTLEIIEIKGIFANTSNIFGVTSGANAVITTSIDDYGVQPFYDWSDNKTLDNVSDSFITTDSNPLGRV